MAKVMETGILSKYLGAWHGSMVGQRLMLEHAWAKRFGAKHAVAVTLTPQDFIVLWGLLALSLG